MVIVMTCMACRRSAPGWVCETCRLTLAPAPDRSAGRVLVRSGFQHGGAARLLVHRIKYEAVAGVAQRVAPVLAALLPTTATSLIPIRRVLARRWRYGVDPAVELARAVCRRTGLPMADVLRPPVWTKRRAGPAGVRRGVPSFSLRAPAPGGAVLIDDVVTTGTTIAAAAAITRSTHALTLTSAGVGVRR